MDEKKACNAICAERATLLLIWRNILLSRHPSACSAYLSFYRRNVTHVIIAIICKQVLFGLIRPNRFCIVGAYWRHGYILLASTNTSQISHAASEIGRFSMRGISFCSCPSRSGIFRRFRSNAAIFAGYATYSFFSHVHEWNALQVMAHCCPPSSLLQCG